MPVTTSHAAGQVITASDVNALAALANANETALAGKADTSALAAKLDASTASATYHPRAVWDDFTTKSDGLLTTADSGQSYYLFPASGTEAAQVVSGKATAPKSTGTVASYPQIALGGPIGRTFVETTFSPYSTPGGVLALPLFKTLNTGVAVPDTDAHITIGPEGWVVGKFVSGTFTQLANVAFATPLTADDATSWRWDASVSGHTVTVVVRNTAGYEVARDQRTHSDIKATGRIACIEIYASAAATDTKPKVLRWGASCVEDLPLRDPAGVQVAVWAPASESDTFVPTSQAAINTTYLRVPYKVPASGSFQVDLSGFLSFVGTTACDVYWGVRVGGTGLGTQLVEKGGSVTRDVMSGVTVVGTVATGETRQRRASLVVTGQTPGAVLQLDWDAFATVLNNAIFEASLGNGKQAVMKITPIQ